MVEGKVQLKNYKLCYFNNYCYIHCLAIASSVSHRTENPRRINNPGILKGSSLWRKLELLGAGIWRFHDKGENPESDITLGKCSHNNWWQPQQRRFNAVLFHGWALWISCAKVWPHWWFIFQDIHLRCVHDHPPQCLSVLLWHANLPASLQSCLSQLATLVQGLWASWPSKLLFLWTT